MEFLKKKAVYIAVILLASIGGFIYYSSSKEEVVVRYTTSLAEKSTIVSSLSGTGQIASESKIELKPESSGKITSLSVSVGQAVKSSQVIATIDQKNALVSYNQAVVALKNAEANYKKIIAGAVGADVEMAKNSITSAEQSVKNAQINVDRVKQQQDTAVTNARRALFNSGMSAVPANNNLSTAIPTISGSYTGTVEGEYRITLYMSGSGMRYLAQGIESYDGTINAASPTKIGNLGLYIQFPSTINVADSWIISIPNKQASNYVTNFNAFATAEQNRITAIENAEQSVVNAEMNLAQAKLSLEQKIEAATPEEVESAQVQIESARVQLQSAQNTLASTVIRAPFDGQIATVGARTGEQVSTGSVIATLITKQQVAKISLNEVDAARVAKGQKVTLIFDAVDELSLTGHVASINPIGTVSQGVVSYEVTIGLDTQDDRIKDGMSVTAAIMIDTKTDVIAVPSSAVKTQGGASYVEVFSKDATFTSVPGQTGMVASEAPVRVSVETGITSDTSVEIVSGISENDIIVVQTIAGSTAQAPASAGSSLRIPGLTGGTTRGAAQPR